MNNFDWNILIKPFGIFTGLLIAYLTYPIFTASIFPNEPFTLWTSPLEFRHGQLFLVVIFTLAVFLISSNIIISMRKNQPSLDLTFWFAFVLFIIKTLAINFLIFAFVFESSINLFEYFSMENTITLIISLFLGLIAAKKFG